MANGRSAQIELSGKAVQVAMSDFTVSALSEGDKSSVALNCPHCRNKATFEPLRPLSWQQTIESWGITITASLRICPNERCQRPIFTVSRGIDLLFSFPPEIIDFDASGVPDEVRGALEEAILCHSAGCYRASAIMVRRTLEEICAERGAEGRDLKARIASLSALITVPKALLDAMDELRLLGNDAAHIEAKTYEKLGNEEVEAGIALAKEFVKATYQYADLLAKLRNLARQP